MTKQSGLRAVDGNYATHAQMWEETRACNAGAKEVVKLVSSMPAPSYSTLCGQFRYDHLDEELILKAQNLNHNRNLANIQRINEYWKRGRFSNYVGRTLESNHGMMWNHHAEKDLSPKMEYADDNFNGYGLSVDDFAKDCTYELELTGRYGALADMAETSSSMTVAQQDDPALQPRAISYKAEDILAVYVMEGKVVDIRLNEDRTESSVDNEFEYECKQYTRRLVMIDGTYYNQLFNDKEEKVSEIAPRANGSNFSFIPFVFFGADSNSPAYSKVPLFDLAHINLGHFVLDCDNRDNLHYHGQGTTLVTTDMQAYEFDALNPAGLDTGAKGKNVLKQGDDIKLVQLAATGAIPEEMGRDQERMIQLGAQIVMPAGQNMTLGQKKIEAGASLSTLARISHNTSEGMTTLLGYMAMMKGDTQESTYKVNSKFITDDMTPEMLNAQMAMVQGGVLPSETLNESARRAGLTKLDDEQIKQKLLEDGESLTGDSEEVAQLKAELEALKSGQE